MIVTVYNGRRSSIVEVALFRLCLRQDHHVNSKNTKLLVTNNSNFEAQGIIIIFFLFFNPLR